MLLAVIIIVQIIIFIGLIIFFRRIMNQNVVLATRHLEELNEDYTKKEQEINRRQQEIEQQADKIIRDAQDEAEKLKLEIITNAEQERDSIISSARAQSEEIVRQADKSRQQLLAEIDEQVAKESIGKACELIENALPKEFKQVVHSQWVEDLIEGGFSRLERLRIPEDVQEVKIVTAFALNDEQRKKINKKLTDTFGRQLKIKEEVNPKIVTGLVINVGSLVLDGSLKNKIKEKVK